MSRAKKTIKNIIISFVGYFAVLLCSLISRSIFIRYMGIELMGVGQLFSNILTMLSYSQLGIGTAIIYSLYKYLEEKNTEKIKSLMYFYRKCFRLIGIGIIIFAFAALPFVNFFVDDSVLNIPHVHIAFSIFGINAAISYFIAYKRSIIIAEQNRYLSTLNTDIASVVQLCIQIIVIVFTQNYILYLLINTICLLASNILISRRADILYPYLKERDSAKLEKTEKRNIIKTTITMLEQKIGFVVIFAMDSLLIAKFIGVSAVGIYANYLIVLNGLKYAINIIFQSVIASIGNVIAVESKEKLNETFEVLNLLGFWIHNFSAVSLFILFNPFISLWLGEEYVFSTFTVLILVINFYLDGMRKPVITCKDALGLQWNDRYKPVIEGVLNLLLSLLLIQYMGMAGIFIAMSVSTILSSCWIEPFVFYKYGLGKSPLIYFKKYLKQILIAASSLVLAVCLSKLICGDEKSFTAFLVKIIICIIIPNSIMLIVFIKTKEFQVGKNTFKSILNLKK